MSVEFGLTAQDYRRYRAGYPEELFERLVRFNVGAADQRILDIGTGTGYLGRGFGIRGSSVTGLDPSRDLLEQARQLDEEQNLICDYVVGVAENLPFAEASFDVVTAGQCWHWFDRGQAAAEASRVLKEHGRLVIVHFDWIPLDSNTAAETEDLILRHNPHWDGAYGVGMHPQWLTDVALAGFEDIETFTFDTNIRYSHEAWRGRIRASAGVGASLSDEQVKAFDSELAQMLATKFSEDPIHVLHRSFALICKKT